jgi:hypothetical protein
MPFDLSTKNSDIFVKMELSLAFIPRRGCFYMLLWLRAVSM